MTIWSWNKSTFTFFKSLLFRFSLLFDGLLLFLFVLHYLFLYYSSCFDTVLLLQHFFVFLCLSVYLILRQAWLNAYVVRENVNFCTNLAILHLQYSVRYISRIVRNVWCQNGAQAIKGLGSTTLCYNFTQLLPWSRKPVNDQWLSQF